MYPSSSSNQHDLSYPTSNTNPSNLYPPLPPSGPKLGFEHLYTQPESFNNTSSSSIVLQPTRPSSPKPSKPIPSLKPSKPIPSPKPSKPIPPPKPSKPIPLPRTIPPANTAPPPRSVPPSRPVPLAKNSSPRRKCQEIICKICNKKVTNKWYQSLEENKSNFCYRCQHQSGNWDQPLISLDPKTLEMVKDNLANDIEKLIENNIEHLIDVNKCDACDNQISEFVYTCTMCNYYYLCKTCEACSKHPEHVLIGIPYNLYIYDSVSDASNVNQPEPSTSTQKSNKTPSHKSKKHSRAKRLAENLGVCLVAKLAFVGIMAAFGLESFGDFLNDPGGGDGSME